jgi:NADPH:quinone reductase-like Zn-dependent oxidoreductase
LAAASINWLGHFEESGMKAVRLASPGGLERLSLVEIDDPGEPGPEEIRVRIRASSLNFHDFGVVSGRKPVADGIVPMSDGAGVVETVGEAVAGFAAGDAVVSGFFPFWQDGPPRVGDFAKTPGDGTDGYAREVVVAAATSFTRAPAGWNHVEAATITTAGLTAWRALVVDAGIRPGDRVLCLGTGGVSVYALQIARAAGAEVAITSSSDSKLERARELGADLTVNYVTTPEWHTPVLDWTGGEGVDCVVEVGGPGTLGRSIQACRIGGHIALIGVLTGRAGEIPTGLLMARQIRLQGLIVGSRAQQQDMVRGMEATGIRPVIDSIYPLAEIAAAFRHEEAGAHFGKIALEI